MKNKPSLTQINLEHVNSLETYLWHLGVMSISVQTLLALQEKAESIGIFDNDEIEGSKTVKYQTQRLLQCCNDLLKMCASRTQLEWPQLMKKIIESSISPNKSKRKKK